MWGRWDSERWGHGDSTVWDMGSVGFGDGGIWGRGDGRTRRRGDIRIRDTATAPLPPRPSPSPQVWRFPSAPLHPIPSLWPWGTMNVLAPVRRDRVVADLPQVSGEGAAPGGRLLPDPAASPGPLCVPPHTHTAVLSEGGRPAHPARIPLQCDRRLPGAADGHCGVRLGWGWGIPWGPSALHKLGGPGRKTPRGCGAARLRHGAGMRRGGGGVRGGAGR